MLYASNDSPDLSCTLLYPYLFLIYGERYNKGITEKLVNTIMDSNCSSINENGVIGSKSYESFLLFSILNYPKYPERKSTDTTHDEVASISYIGNWFALESKENTL